jgi:hypothetical protein
VYSISSAFCFGTSIEPLCGTCEPVSGSLPAGCWSIWCKLNKEIPKWYTKEPLVQDPMVVLYGRHQCRNVHRRESSDVQTAVMRRIYLFNVQTTCDRLIYSEYLGVNGFYGHSSIISGSASARNDTKWGVFIGFVYQCTSCVLKPTPPVLVVGLVPPARSVVFVLKSLQLGISNLR